MAIAETQKWYSSLPKPALYYPERAKKLLKECESHYTSWWVVAKTSAVLGDISTARRVLNALIDLGDEFYYSYIAEIAADLDDTATAEEMMWKVIRRNEEDNASYNSLRVTTVEKPEVAYHLMNALERQGYDVGIPAAHILRNINLFCNESVIKYWPSGTNIT